MFIAQTAPENVFRSRGAKWIFKGHTFRSSGAVMFVGRCLYIYIYVVPPGRRLAGFTCCKNFRNTTLGVIHG